jgi:hypothetical protein
MMRNHACVAVALGASAAACGGLDVHFVTAANAEVAAHPWSACEGKAEAKCRDAFQQLQTTHQANAAREPLLAALASAVEEENAAAQGQVHYDAAVVALALGDVATARSSIRTALALAPTGDADALRAAIPAGPATTLIDGNEAFHEAFSRPAPALVSQLCRAHAYRGTPWDGRETFCCEGIGSTDKELSITGVRASLPGKIAFVVGSQCKVRIKDSNIDADQIFLLTSSQADIQVERSTFHATYAIATGTREDTAAHTQTYYTFRDSHLSSDDLGLFLYLQNEIHLVDSQLVAPRALWSPAKRAPQTQIALSGSIVSGVRTLRVSDNAFPPVVDRSEILGSVTSVEFPRDPFDSELRVETRNGGKVTGPLAGKVRVAPAPR